MPVEATFTKKFFSRGRASFWFGFLLTISLLSNQHNNKTWFFDININIILFLTTCKFDHTVLRECIICCLPVDTAIVVGRPSLRSLLKVQFVPLATVHRLRFSCCLLLLHLHCRRRILHHHVGVDNGGEAVRIRVAVLLLHHHWRYLVSFYRYRTRYYRYHSFTHCLFLSLLLGWAHCTGCTHVVETNHRGWYCYFVRQWCWVHTTHYALTTIVSQLGGNQDISFVLLHQISREKSFTGVFNR